MLDEEMEDIDVDVDNFGNTSSNLISTPKVSTGNSSNHQKPPFHMMTPEAAAH